MDTIKNPTGAKLELDPRRTPPHGDPHRLVPQPEPAPERPEWVRLPFGACGHEARAVLRPESWDEDGDPGIRHADGHRVYFVVPGAWEPADPPTPEPGEERWAGEGDIEPVDRPASADLSGKSGPAAEWKVGDWFTVDAETVAEEYDLTEGKPYRVVEVVGDNSVTCWLADLLAEVDRLRSDLDAVAEIFDEVAKVYCHVTDGRISKPNTVAFDVIGEADAFTERLIAAALAEHTGDDE